MEILNKRAISEVIAILNHTDKEIVEKIPEKFIKFLFENADKEYNPTIDFYNNNWDDTIEEDTKAILAIIYRDYIVLENERIELLKEEREEKIKNEQELREKYNPDDIFKRKQQKETINNAVNNLQLIEIKETPWYKRLYQKIIAIFGIQK